MQCLTHLDLSNTCITAEAFAALCAPGAGTTSTLQRLVASYLNCVGDAEIERIGANICGLRYLDLRGCVGVRTLKGVDGLRALIEINLAGTGVGDTGASRL